METVVITPSDVQTHVSVKIVVLGEKAPGFIFRRTIASRPRKPSAKSEKGVKCFH